MKTKELIEILQKADPSGECHVRVAGGMPWFAERKEGYWDGMYTYIEGDKLIYSTEGQKVDLHIMELEDWVERYRKNWEDKIEFRLGYLDPSDKIEAVKKDAREFAEYMNELEESMDERFLEEMKEKLQNGWKIVDYSEDGKINPTKIFFEKGLKREQFIIGYIRLLSKGHFKKEGKEWMLA